MSTNNKPKVCPVCGSRKIADILYGLPAWSKEFQEKLDRGETVLGGYIVSGKDPK